MVLFTKDDDWFSIWHLGGVFLYSAKSIFMATLALKPSFSDLLPTKYL